MKKKNKKPTLKNIRKAKTAYISLNRAQRLLKMFHKTNSVKGMSMLIVKGYGKNSGLVRVVFLYNGKAFSSLKDY